MKRSEALKILSHNIDAFSTRIDLSDRQRKICLSQFFDALSDDVEESAETLYRRFVSALPLCSYEDRASFCIHLAQVSHHQAKLWERMDLDSEDETLAGAHGKIAFVRNRYNEQAFSVFEPLVIGARAEILSSFTDACEDVFDNRCEYCILPIENTGDGRLFGFYSMLDRYELKICASCTLEHESTPDTIRYALVGKHLPNRIPKTTEWFYEFSLASENDEFPYDIFSVAPIFSAKLLQIDSLPLQYDDLARRIYFTFHADKVQAAALDLYLSAEHPGLTVLGLYPML